MCLEGYDGRHRPPEASYVRPNNSTGPHISPRWGESRLSSRATNISPLRGEKRPSSRPTNFQRLRGGDTSFQVTLDPKSQILLPMPQGQSQNFLLRRFRAVQNTNDRPGMHHRDAVAHAKDLR